MINFTQGFMKKLGEKYILANRVTAMFNTDRSGPLDIKQFKHGTIDDPRNLQVVFTPKDLPELELSVGTAKRLNRIRWMNIRTRIVYPNGTRGPLLKHGMCSLQEVLGFLSTQDDIRKNGMVSDPSLTMEIVGVELSNGSRRIKMSAETFYKKYLDRDYAA